MYKNKKYYNKTTKKIRQPHNNRIKYMQINPKLLVKKAKSPCNNRKIEIKNSFESLNLHPIIKRNIQKKGYKNPTIIQDKAITQILKGLDIIGLASTGTGKTGAFLIPLIHKVTNLATAKVLIIAPTRELALQIVEEGKSFSLGTRAYFTLVIGGVDIQRQIRDLKRNPSFVVGTPGRIKDLFERGHLNLIQFNSIVLDEVDRMLDMGFINDIRFIVNKLPKVRQSLFFSATMTPKAKEVAKEFLNNPEFIKVHSSTPSENVHQNIIKTRGLNKEKILKKLLGDPALKKVLIFGRTKRGLDKLHKSLLNSGFSVNIIHGDKSQNYRQRALRNFKNNKIRILLATDVASRGIDVKDITHVINYELPESYQVYIHRIGRTGRANKVGFALTFID